MVTYCFGPFRLLPHVRRLERDGVMIALTPKAFDLLLALVMRRERALSKDEIMSLVWPDSIVEESNLAQQVLLLRRALADGGEYVATVPRFGYRFVSDVVEDHGTASGRVRSPHCVVWDGREFSLREGVTVVGRGDDADLQISLPSLSRRHARLVVRGWEATIEDLGSRHGTWRGAVAVQGAVRLTSGDEIRLGTVQIVYCLVMPDDTTQV